MENQSWLIRLGLKEFVQTPVRKREARPQDYCMLRIIILSPMFLCSRDTMVLKPESCWNVVMGNYTSVNNKTAGFGKRGNNIS